MPEYIKAFRNSSFLVTSPAASVYPIATIMRIFATFSTFITASNVKAAYLPTESWVKLVPAKLWDANVGASSNYDSPFALEIHVIDGDLPTNNAVAASVDAAEDASIHASPSKRTLLRQIQDGQIQEFKGGPCRHHCLFEFWLMSLF